MLGSTSELNSYNFNVFEKDGLNIIGQGFGLGYSACDALEKALKQGTVIVENGREYDIIVYCGIGLSLKFHIHKAFS